MILCSLIVSALHIAAFVDTYLHVLYVGLHVLSLLIITFLYRIFYSLISETLKRRQDLPISPLSFRTAHTSPVICRMCSRGTYDYVQYALASSFVELSLPFVSEDESAYIEGLPVRIMFTPTNL